MKFKDVNSVLDYNTTPFCAPSDMINFRIFRGKLTTKLFQNEYLRCETMTKLCNSVFINSCIAGDSHRFLLNSPYLQNWFRKCKIFIIKYQFDHLLIINNGQTLFSHCKPSDFWDWKQAGWENLNSFGLCRQFQTFWNYTVILILQL